MLTMLRRVLNKEAWRKAAAGKKPKRLKLVPDKNGIYTCPINACDSNGFKSKRGCRKHVYSRHGWYYFYDEKPNVAEVFPETLVNKNGYKLPTKASTSDMPTFSKDCMVAKAFKTWLCSAGGSSKNPIQADQIVGKLLKFAKFCCDDMPCACEISFSVIDYCVNSVTMIQDFMEHLTEKWKVGNSGKIAYLNSLCHYLDYQRSKGNISERISQFMAAEVFITRAKRSFCKNMRIEWNTTLGIENFEKMNCWATLSELQKVVPYHQPRYQQIVLIAKSLEPRVSSHDLSFCTSFIVSVLFLMVKGTRPMTYQFLTIEMIDSAKKTGFIDQTVFKTNEKYGFDSLIFTREVLEYVNNYILYIRTCLNPKCDYLLINRNGLQLSKLSDILGRLVYEAIGKYIHPTRYRQIIETESASTLSIEEQEIISRDQKHTSNVAKVHYQKLKSRDIAVNARESMAKLLKFTANNKDKNSTNNEKFNKKIVKDTEENTDLKFTANNKDKNSKNNGNFNKKIVKDTEENTDFFIENSNKANHKEEVTVSIRTKAANEKQRCKKVPFTNLEDQFIVDGIRKYGRGKWTNILNDTLYKFHPSRKACTLCVRAKKKGFL